MTGTRIKGSQEPSGNVRGQLDMMLDELKGSSGKLPYKRLAGDLSKVARKQPEWSRRYILSVHKGTIEPSRKLAQAVMDLGAYYDGHGLRLTVGASEVKITTHDPEGIAGAYIMGKPKICTDCGARLVPNVPWRRKCPSCSPPR